MILLLNFAHALSKIALAEIGEQLGGEVRVKNIPVNLILSEPMEPQMEAIVTDAGLTPDEWQMLSIVINPPGMAPAATTLIAMLHGLMGYFPAQIRLIQDGGTFHLAEIQNLQEVRNRARQERF